MFQFNSQATSQPSVPAFNFGQTAQPAISSTAPTSFSFPQQPQTTFSQPQTSFSFNTNQLTQPIQPLQQTQPLQQLQPFQPLQQLQPSTNLNQWNPLQPSITTTTTAGTVADTRGLGGEGTSGGQINTNNKSAKDQHLPPELNSLVESFKTFIKDTKLIRDENAQSRFSVQPIVDINSELDVLRVKMEGLEVTLQKNKKNTSSLKQETSRLVSDAETAHRALKSESISSISFPLGPDKYVSSKTTLDYFHKLVDTFEERMNIYSQKIKELEISLDHLQKPIQTQDLLTVVEKQHQALVALAAEIYGVHETVSKISGADHQEQNTIVGKTIDIGGEQVLPSEKQISKPIAFPTFSFQKKSTF